MGERRHLLEGLAGPTVALEAVNRATHEFTGRQARRAGLHPTDLWALRLLDVYGDLGPTELARRLDLRPASTTALIDRLVAAGHLERVPGIVVHHHPQDKINPSAVSQGTMFHQEITLRTSPLTNPQ